MNGRQHRKSNRDFALPWSDRFNDDGLRLSAEGADDMLYDPKISRSRWPLPFRQQSWETMVALVSVIVLVGIVCANLPGAWVSGHVAPVASVSHTAN
jgi:hypothetical protein